VFIIADVNAGRVRPIVLESGEKRNGGKKASRGKKKPDNRQFLFSAGVRQRISFLQTEPQIQEVRGIDERGHDFFPVTDARPDTGDFPERTPAKPYRGVRLIPIDCPMQLSVCRFHG